MRTHSWDVLAELPVTVPERVADVARRFAATGTAVEPLLAASVILVRDADAIETYLLHRHARMPFAASMVVFPGGRLDLADRSGPEVLVGGTDDAALRRCAVRETHEETGVALGPADLVPWAHWITPEAEPRRYDTHFYLAALPDGAVAADVSGETDTAAWSTAQEALAAADRGEIGLMPPTRSILIELAEAPDVAALLAAAAGRVVAPVTPRIEPASDGWRFVYPRREQ